MKISETFQVTLPSDTEILVSREFDAPRERVWAAHTQAELLKRWVSGPPGWKVTRCDLDMRTGGEAFYSWTGPDGSSFSLHQKIREFLPTSKIVAEERFDMGAAAAMPVQYVTMQFSDVQKRTLLQMTLRYDSKQDRDGALASGMNDGMAASYDLLDGVFAGKRA